jgi:replication-associated recombination protein RarA
MHNPTHTNSETLISKYRPTNLTEMVLPWQHGLTKALDFLSNPYPEAFLFYGCAGLGKTSLARIMAHAAAGDPFSVRYLSGPDLDSNTVRDIAAASYHPPLFGKYYAYVVDEADQTPRGGQIRLFSLLENLGHTVWIFTSNESMEEFEPRFVSRVKPLLFSKQGIMEPATEWLLSIAQKEGISLSKTGAANLIRESNNNLRMALQALELKGADQKKRHQIVPSEARKTVPEPALNDL